MNKSNTETINRENMERKEGERPFNNQDQTSPRDSTENYDREFQQGLGKNKSEVNSNYDSDEELQQEREVNQGMGTNGEELPSRQRNKT